MGPVSMAGFPFWQLDRFLKILVQDLNKYVAISEEFRIDHSGRSSSSGLIHERRVTRIVTPGTLIDEKFLDPFANNFLLALYPEVIETQESKDDVEAGNINSSMTSIGLAWLDLSTGEFYTQLVAKALLPSALARIRPREVIVAEDIMEKVKEEIDDVMGQDRHLMTLHSCTSRFDSITDWNAMLERDINASDYGHLNVLEREAGHQLLDYVKTRLVGFNIKLQPPRQRQLTDILSIDRSSMRGLEILQTSRDGHGKGSLLHSVNRTVTRSGARLLRDRLTAPSANEEDINARLDLVTTFLHDSELRDRLTTQLKRTFDVQRLVQKFALRKGDADDLICLFRAIDASVAVKELLDSAPENGDANQTSLKETAERLQLKEPSVLAQRIRESIDEQALLERHRIEEEEAADLAALASEVVLAEAGPNELEKLPKSIRASKGKSEKARDADGAIQEPFVMSRTASEALELQHAKLDELKQAKVDLERKLQDKFSKSLTLRWTPGLGHICHISRNNGSAAVFEAENIRPVNSTKSTSSFYLSSWTQLGGQMGNARLRIQEEENRVFADLRKQVIKNLVKLRRNAAVMDELDVACSFAKVTEEQGWVRPILTTQLDHKIIGGRHPTVKLGLEEQGRTFVSNDLILGNKERIWLVTGPNMAGKSTFLRQNALIAILAQTGSYVPAQYAEIGMIDQIFSRIGAADDLFRDQSTFMVEMLETATILRHATKRSFVIMDEVGRGTTPEDGTAVGFAALHHLYHINQCRALFATHFHALADMTSDFPHLARYCTDVLVGSDGSFSFAHQLRPGVNRHSHALKVARLAGLPESALEVAEQSLKRILDEKAKDLPGPLPAEQFEQPQMAAAAG